jgi:hypothetical protein
MQYLDDDVVDLRRDDGTTWQYYWGDRCEVLSEEGGKKRVQMFGLKGPVDEGFISPKTNLRDTGLLRLSMVDVQQGDGLILDTPAGKVVFIDGGDSKLFARHAAARYAGTSAANPLLVDAVIVTHGDADHFDGLSDLIASEKNREMRKRIFVAPRRVYHNGLVKRPGKIDDVKVAETAMFGAVTDVGDRPFATELVDDPRTVPEPQLNKPFKKWVRTLGAWAARLRAVVGEEMIVRRLDHTIGDAFDFLEDEDVHVELLGPITEDVDGTPGLAFLSDPPDDARLMLGLKPGTKPGSWSASHTINGHSIFMRIRYGNVRFLMTGDMNEESMNRLRAALPNARLRAEILKTPHHGSADFNYGFLQEVSPVVSLISSGDESEQKEYIHPRATLMAALGKASRTMPGIIFCTELAAFFAMRGYVQDPKDPTRNFFAFERTNFGIAHIRTDGERVLAFTHSGKKGFNEAYRFTVSPSGEIEFAPQVSKRSAPKLT